MPTAYRARILRAAFAKAGVGNIDRSTNDLGLTKATQAWLAGVSRAALQTRLGNAERLEARMFGHMVGHNGASPP